MNSWLILKVVMPPTMILCYTSKESRTTLIKYNIDNKVILINCSVLCFSDLFHSVPFCRLVEADITRHKCL